jgi:hypothetical protein
MGVAFFPNGVLINCKNTMPQSPKTTAEAYQFVIGKCKEVFLKKSRDYGTSWQILRLPSVTDQLYIKAQRIRGIEETGINKVGDEVDTEYLGIINYCVIALLLMKFKESPAADSEGELSEESLSNLYNQVTQSTFELMENKNHDYGEAWREMRISSLTDMILTKLMRLKKIEDNQGALLISEGPEGSYMDILNYSVFALIRLWG